MHVQVQPLRPCAGDEPRAPSITNLDVQVETSHEPRRLCWLLVAGLHGLSIAYHGLMAVVYIHSRTLAAPFGPVMYIERTILDRKHFHVVGAGAGVLASIHVLLLARMIRASVVTRRLTFRLVELRMSSSMRLRIKSALSSMSARRLRALPKRSIPSQLQPVVNLFKYIRFHLTQRQGLLGIDGPHFESVFLARELFQISFQSYQAWRMAGRVPIGWLNRFNVVLACVNCWSMPLLEWRLKRQRQRQAQRTGPDTTMLGSTPVLHTYRLQAILVDCCLDSLAVSVMSLVIFLPYLGMLNPELEMFRLEFWLSERWVARTMNEFQIVFVVNWLDAVSRVLFALLTIVSLQAVHDLCHDHFDSRTSQPLGTARSVVASIEGRHDLSRPHRLARVGMVLWGCIIAALHAHASWLDSPQHCALPIRPWDARKPACAVVILNCYRIGTHGSQDVIETAFQSVSSHHVSLIIVKHCSALEMPRTLPTHDQLISLHVHNATLVRWDADARLTRTTNPMLQGLSFTRFMWPGGQFPTNLFATDPPSTLGQIHIQLSNLHSLPSDLHVRLPQLLVVTFELCQFRVFPSTLIHLEAAFISVAGSYITSLPLAQLIAPGRAIRVIAAAFNPISEFSSDSDAPGDPEISPQLLYLTLYNTSVASLPSWVLNSPVLKQGPLVVLLGGSPICAATIPPVSAISCTPPQPWDDVNVSIAIQDGLNPL